MHQHQHIKLYRLDVSFFLLECSSLVDVLCSLTTKLDSILDPLNNDDDFLACLFYCLFHLTEENTQSPASPSSHGSGGFTGYVPASWLQMRSAANRVFCKMLELKRKVCSGHLICQLLCLNLFVFLPQPMEEIFHVQFSSTYSESFVDE